MSTKKDKFSKKDKKYMNLALNIARIRRGLTGKNPSVGCVITKNDKIISIGQTGYNGTPHAEANAIKNSYNDLKGSKMYITLEPCNHYGKTPPCTKNIIKNGISEVFYSIDDIDKKVKGKSLRILSKKNIKVRKGLLNKEARNLYNSYFINRKYKIPFVTGKIAISKNKLIYSNKFKRITDKISDKLTHYLRYKNDAIMVSAKTLNIDNPRLNCRIKGFENFSPIRVILDRNLKIKLNSYIIKSVKNNNTFIFFNSAKKDKVDFLKRKGINLVKSQLNKKKQFVLKKILKKLYTLGINNLLVEGGDKITKSFLNNRLFNEFFLFESQKNLSKEDEYVLFTSMNLLNKKYNINQKKSSKLDRDILRIYER